MSCTDCQPVWAIWAQPIALMDQWKAVGINTLIHFEPEGGRYSQAQWRAQAAAKGFNYIDVPSANIAADNADPHLVAFLQEDEPDGHNWPVSVWSDRYNAIRAVSQKPIYGNFNGSVVTAALDATPPYDGHRQKPFIPFANWLGFDWYTINRDINRYGNTPLMLRAYDALKTWSNGKPQIPFVECSDQNISANGRAPTTDEMKTQVRAMMNRGAMGVAFFPQRIAGDVHGTHYSFTYNNTTPAMCTAMTEVMNEFNPVAAAKVQKHILWSDGTWTSV